MAALLDRVSEDARRAGIGFAYHHHDFEFRAGGGIVPYGMAPDGRMVDLGDGATDWGAVLARWELAGIGPPAFQVQVSGVSITAVAIAPAPDRARGLPTGDGGDGSWWPGPAPRRPS